MSITMNHGEEPLVKIGVTYSSTSHLFGFRKSGTLQSIVEEICAKFSLTTPENYCLAIERENLPTQYVTEDNRTSLLQPGVIYSLRISPVTRVQKHVETLQDPVAPGDIVTTLEECADLLSHSTYAKNFVGKEGHTYLFRLITWSKFDNGVDPKCYGQVLRTVVALSTYATSADSLELGGLFVWSLMPESCLSQLYKLVTSFHTPLNVLSPALQILAAILKTETSRLPEMVKEITADIFYDQLCRVASEGFSLSECPRDMEYSFVCFLVSLFEGAERSSEGKANLEDYSLAYLRLPVLRERLPALKTSGNLLLSETDRILTVLARLTRYVLWDLRRDLVTPLEEDEQRLLNLGVLVGYRPPQRLLGPDLDSCHIQVLKRLGFTTPDVPLRDFQRCPPGQLAYKCLRRFSELYANKIPQHFRSLLEGEHNFPYVQAAHHLVLFLCHYFNITDSWESPPAATSGCKVETERYQPLLFVSMEGVHLETLCSEALFTFLDTWCEMRGTERDFLQVFEIVKVRLLGALRKLPPALDWAKFRAYLMEVRVADAVVQLKTRFLEGQRSDQHPAVMQLVSHLKSHYRTCLSESRVNLIQEGKRFTMNKEQVEVKYCRRSKCLQEIRGDSREMISLEWLQSATMLGPEDNQMYFITVTKGNNNSQLKLPFSSKEECTLWLDAFNIVCKKSEMSGLFLQQMNVLVEIDKQIRLLGLPLHSIPSQPPPLPELPATFEYAKE